MCGVFILHMDATPGSITDTGVDVPPSTSGLVLYLLFLLAFKSVESGK